MLLVISPAKKLDFSAETRFTELYTQPAFLDESQLLVDELSKMEPARIGALMDLSAALAQLNYERYQRFSRPFTPENAKQALLAFKGEVYQSFPLEQYEQADFDFAQAHLRILSGLYGLLRPLDLIQPYRLEMGTHLLNARGRNLYEFWGERITEALSAELKALGTPWLINLASEEYFKAVRPARLGAQVITPLFKEARNGKLQSIFLYAKQARGAMANFAIRQRLSEPEGLKAFTGMGYRFLEEASSEHTWVFAR
jgi:hypothetical protein